MKIEEVTRYAQAAQREERGQVVHIPASLQRRNGSYNRMLRTVQVQGACRVMSPYWKSSYEQRIYSTPAEFGIVIYQGKRYAVVRRQDDTYWEAVEVEPIPSLNQPTSRRKRG